MESARNNFEGVYCVPHAGFCTILAIRYVILIYENNEPLPVMIEMVRFLINVEETILGRSEIVVSVQAAIVNWFLQGVLMECTSALFSPYETSQFV
jgi:hypothetical protein